MAKVVKTPDKYPVPSNWVWVKLGDLSETKSGYPFDSKRFTVKNESAKPLIRIRDVVRGYSETYTDEECPDSYFIKSGDILIGMDGDFNVSKWQSADALLNQRVCTIKSSSKLLLDDFLFYFLPQPLKQVNDATPSVTVKHLSTSTVSKILIPVPPLAEQQRIVDRIEELFIDLDKAKEKAQQIVVGYEQRRAAILADAFAGNLTKQWREANRVSISEWKKCRFDQVAEIKSNLVDPADYQDYPHIAPNNIEKRSGVLLDYNTISEDKVTSGKHRFFPGQILYSKIRPYLSKVTAVDFDGLCSADMYPIEAKENTRYLLYFMLSDEFLEQASSAGSRSVLPKINQKELSALKVRIPNTEEEQAEIVRILDELLADEQRIKEAAEETLAKIELMKKSILADAFRGKLGTNDPNDQPAAELLKEILI